MCRKYTYLKFIFQQQQSGNENPADLRDYFRTDFHVNDDWNKKLQVALNIRNLFDRDNFLPSVWNSEGGRPEPEINGALWFTLHF